MTTYILNCSKLEFFSFTWLWNLLSHCEEREWTGGVRVQGNETELWEHSYLLTSNDIRIMRTLHINCGCFLVVAR